MSDDKLFTLRTTQSRTQTSRCYDYTASFVIFGNCDGIGLDTVFNMDNAHARISEATLGIGWLFWSSCY